MKNIKKWFRNKFINRYLRTIDSSLLPLFSEREENIPTTNNRELNIKAKRIINKLSSKRYRIFFYKAVKYNIKNSKGVIRPFGSNIRDRISKLICILYLRFFRKKLYKNIVSYIKWKGRMSKIESQVNEYMLNTTYDERIDRARIRGILSNEKALAQKRMLKINRKLKN